MSLLAIGLTTLDVAMAPVTSLPVGEKAQLVERIEAQPAGTAAGCAYVAARLGVPVRLAGAVGDDRIGRFVRMMLEEGGVDTGLLQTLEGQRTSTTVLAIDPDGHRPRWHARGAAMHATASPALAEAARAARFVHWAGIAAPGLWETAPDYLAAARAAGAIVTCDLISPPPNARDILKAILPHVDYFLPSAVEANLLSGSARLDEAAETFLALGARNCLIKDGVDGVYLAIDGAAARLPAHRITPVDTTSCGDSFCAGFIAALGRGWSPLDAARFATTTAALVASAVGTVGALDSFEATEHAMTTLPLRSLA